MDSDFIRSIEWLTGPTGLPMADLAPRRDLIDERSSEYEIRQRSQFIVMEYG